MELKLFTTVRDMQMQYLEKLYHFGFADETVASYL